MSSQPLTDLHGRVHRSLRISIIDKCDLRCTYCMPEDQHFLLRKDLMTREEILRIARIFVEQHGITKIRITGGEPLVRQDVSEIVGDLSRLPVKLGLSSNGMLLDRHLNGLMDAGLKSINISLDTFREERFMKLSRRTGAERVLRNIHLAMDAGLRVKLNMVVMRGVNEEELIEFVALTEKQDIHVRFIEFMPFAGNGWGREKVVTYYEMLQRIRGGHPIEKLNDEASSTAKAWRVLGWKGTFAVISTVSEPFCGDCDRLRITAEGRMRNCLFSREESDLLSALRNGEDVDAMIRRNVMGKHAMLGGLPPMDLHQGPMQDLSARPMVAIGG
jgi:molybdenum cofactor biosynthesis protein A